MREAQRKQTDQEVAVFASPSKLQKIFASAEMICSRHHRLKSDLCCRPAKTPTAAIKGGPVSK